MGPTNINGRITSIAVDPSNNQRMYATSVGGIWRSQDGGRRWERVSDDFLATVFASSAVNPGNTSEVFAGAGDPNYHGSATGTGIWKSTSQGAPGSWSKVTPAALDSQVIYRIRIDPACSQQHLRSREQRSVDGTSGGTAWRGLAGSMPGPMTSQSIFP